MLNNKKQILITPNSKSPSLWEGLGWAHCPSLWEGFRMGKTPKMQE